MLMMKCQLDEMKFVPVYMSLLLTVMRCVSIRGNVVQCPARRGSAAGCRVGVASLLRSRVLPSQASHCLLAAELCLHQSCQ